LDNTEKKLHRKSIRLKDYDYSEEGAYFITACTKERAPYFANHLHVILFLDKTSVAGLVPAQQTTSMVTPTIGKMFGAYKSLCVKKWSDYFNQNNLSGEYSFWQRNDYEHIIRNQRELNLIREYIAYNPVNWTNDNENPDQVYNDEHLKKWGWLEKT
jgi:putative transposase